MIDRLPEVYGKYRKNANIGKLSWLKTDGIADILFIPKDTKDLLDFIIKKPKDLKLYVIGAGSNLLVRESGLRGVTIKLGRCFNYVYHKDGFLIAGAACLDRYVSAYAANHSITNFEFLSGIPGSIGGALAMNAGSHGFDINSILFNATAINLDSGEIRKFNREEIGYSYRSKTLNDNWLFLEAVFLAKKGKQSDILEKLKMMKSIRESAQPIRSKTGGSTFKNPVGYKAWQLIDMCGLRGVEQGDVQFSELHCNFLINKGLGKARDVELLINLAKKKVYEKFLIKLEEEIKIIG